MKRTDIKKIMLIGAGPIVIGQGCEFDYSGVQACKVLKAEGYEVVLINSNPATIMTDPEMAPHTYIEPITPEAIHEIIRRERPDALLPTLGGQTALNAAMEVAKQGILKRYNVEMIGADTEAIARAEDRELFKEAMEKLGLDMPRSVSCHTLEQAKAAAEAIGSWPLVIRPGFTLGGTGGGIAHDPAEFETIVKRGLDASMNSEVLIEESLLGWKEYEMEVMRDRKGNGVIVCSIENLDPMGIHTGDSITVAPIQTLTDREYQAMRDDSLAVLEAIGISTGGSNVQWAVNPKTGRRIIIEMNPRVSRSSALASKATGFPIAKIAALLAVGYTLDELKNDITRETPSCFEPALDYVVVKVPRFTFEKFPTADPHLGTQMKSVGEAMAIGRTFKEAFQKALRSLEVKHAGFGADPKNEMFFPLLDHSKWDAIRTQEWNDEELADALAHPGADRIFQLHEAMRRGWSVERIFELTEIDRWFLRHLDELVKFEEVIASFSGATGVSRPCCADAAGEGAQRCTETAGDEAQRCTEKAGDEAQRCTEKAGDEALLPRQVFAQAKAMGFSDAQIAYLLGCTEEAVRAARLALGLRPQFGAVDTCAGEFKAITPYYYSTNAVTDGAVTTPRGEVTAGTPAAQVPGVTSRRGAGRKIMVLGGGPNRIGQGIEFDYCCCHAAFALRKQGYEVIMVNSNPETVSTDYDTSDKLYFEPLTLEDVMEIYDREQCDGVIVQFGGQTPLNLAQKLRAAGARVIGTSPDDIDRAEDRDFFKALVSEVGMKQPPSGIAHTVAEAVTVANEIGYPVLVRPSFVLGGRGMAIVYKEKYLVKYVEEAVRAGEGKPILIDKFLEHAIELDVDCISDGETTVVGAILEHVEPAGCHSGDSASVTPPQMLSEETIQKCRAYAHEFAKRLHVCGLMNLQLAVTKTVPQAVPGRGAGTSSPQETIWMIEVNPRASRTIPFVSKAIGVPLASYAARCMAGEKLVDIGFTEEVKLPYTCVKEAVFPFVKFSGVDITLTPEMKSTGEVMAIDRDRHIAFFKSQLAAGSKLPSKGRVFLSVKDEDKDDVVPLAKKLVEMGFQIYATLGTSTRLWNEGIRSQAVFRISKGRPCVLDLMREKAVDWIVNTSEPNAQEMVDDIKMRSSAIIHGIPITTTVAGFAATLEGLDDFTRFGELTVSTLQEYHKKLR